MRAAIATLLLASIVGSSAFLTSCSGAAPSASRRAAATSSTEAAAARAAADPPCTPPEATAFLAGEETKTRDEALHALLEGRTQDAIDASGKALDARPIDVGAYAIYSASNRESAEHIEGIIRSATRHAPLKVALTPKKHTRFDPGPAPAARPVALAVAQSLPMTWSQITPLRTQRNFRDPEVSVSGATFEGLRHSQSFIFDDQRVDIFGDTTIVLSIGSFARVFDVSQPASAFTAKSAEPSSQPLSNDPRYMFPRYARASGTDLFVVFASHSDPATTGGEDGFVAAIDLVSGKPRWVSDPLVASSSAVLLTRDHVITSYAAIQSPPPGVKPSYPGKIVALDRATGALVASVATTNPPQAVHAWKGGITTWTNENILEITATPKIEPAPPVAKDELGIAPDRVAPKQTHCRVARVLAALDQRNGDLAETELAHFTPEESVSNLAKALRGAARFLNEPEQNRRLDLTRKAPTRIAGAPSGPKPGLRAAKIAPFVVRKGKVVLGPDPEKEPRKFVQLPSVRGQESPRTTVIEQFGRTSASLTFVVDDITFVAFGTRYLVSVEKGAIKHVLDAEALTALPAGAVSIVHAAYHGKLLLIATSADPSEAERGAATVTAVNPDTGEVVWQSPTRSCAVNFEVVSDRVVCAYGPPGGRDAKSNARLVILRADSGERETELPLPSSPLMLDVIDKEIRVRGQNDVASFEIK